MDIIGNYKGFIFASYVLCTVFMFTFGIIEHPGDAMNRLATAMTQAMMVTILIFSIKVVRDLNKVKETEDVYDSE